jgi:hypothetical protein
MILYGKNTGTNKVQGYYVKLLQVLDFIRYFINSIVGMGCA